MLYKALLLFAIFAFVTHVNALTKCHACEPDDDADSCLSSECSADDCFRMVIHDDYYEEKLTYMGCGNGTVYLKGIPSVSADSQGCYDLKDAHEVCGKKLKSLCYCKDKDFCNAATALQAMAWMAPGLVMVLALGRSVLA